MPTFSPFNRIIKAAVSLPPPFLLIMTTTRRSLRTATSKAVAIVRIFRRNVGNLCLRHTYAATLAIALTAIAATIRTTTRVHRIVLAEHVVISDHYNIAVAVPTNALPTAAPTTTTRTASVIVGNTATRRVCVSTKECIKQITHSISSPSCVFEKTLIL